MLVDNNQWQTAEEQFQSKTDEELQQQIDENPGQSEITNNQSKSVLQEKDLTYVAAILLALFSLLLSLSFRQEGINISYSLHFQHNDILGQMSGAFLLAFGIILKFYKPKKRVYLLYLSLIVCVLAQIYFLTFLLSLISSTYVKEMSITFSYFITGQIGFLSLSYITKIDSKIKQFTIYALLGIATVICMYRFYYFWLFLSVTCSIIYTLLVMDSFTGKQCTELNECILFTLQAWLGLTPTLIAIILNLFMV